jgi:hypothetical protein
MQQTLVRDLTAAQVAGLYNGSPNGFLEVEYKGDAKAAAPADARNGHDLFSVILHEMGHGLGMTKAVAGWGCCRAFAPHALSRLAASYRLGWERCLLEMFFGKVS